VLADISAVRAGADRLARNHYVSEEGSRLKTAMAMVTQSPFQRMVGNFFFRMNQPPYPSRIFRDQHEAMVWLQAHIT
jgi:hypothetical protein